MSDANRVPCLILAGGLSRRMGGGAKFLEEINGKTMLARIGDRLRPQVGDMLLSCNIPIENADMPVRPDVIEGHHGPLAGILTGLEYFIEQGSKATHMLSVPADAPFIPEDLVERLKKGISPGHRSIAMAYSVGRIHAVVALWPLELAADLRKALVEDELRKILVFAERYPLSTVRWTEKDGDPFYNINRPEDLDEARRRVALEKN